MDLKGKLQSWWADRREGRAGKRFEIHCDDSEVSLVSVPSGNEPTLRLRLEQINAVFGYKVDCYSIDQIRLILGNDVTLTWMEVTENDLGFAGLIVELERRLPGFPHESDWWGKVALPAFATQGTEVYRRA